MCTPWSAPPDGSLGAISQTAMIAAIAAANQLPLYTRHPTDFARLDSLITVIEV